MTPCARCRSPLEADDLRCAICAMPTTPARERSARAAARILRCDGCGAAIAHDAAVVAPRCVFCAAVMRVEEPKDPLEVAERVLPFAVSPEQAGESLRAWLATLGFFRPSDLASTSTLEHLRPIHWCGWLVDADAFVSWTADSNAGSGRSSWAPHAGQVAMRFQRLLISASRGLSLAECSKLTVRYDVSRLVEARDVAEGGLIEQFDMQRSAARAMIVSAIERTATARLAEQRMIPGTVFRNVRAAVLLRSLQTERVALSAYVLAYRYKGRSYRAIVHGQDASCTFGGAPYSYTKITLVVVGALAAVGLVVLIATLASNG